MRVFFAFSALRTAQATAAALFSLSLATITAAISSASSIGIFVRKI
jgi:hypothetical protein